MLLTKKKKKHAKIKSYTPIIVFTYFGHFSYYSRLSLSRPCLSRMTAYLEMKIWSLFKHENLTTGNKILWKRGEIALKEQVLLFSTIFSIYL